MKVTQLGQQTPMDDRDIPLHTVSCTTIKLPWGGCLAGAAIAQGLAGHKLIGFTLLIFSPVSLEEGVIDQLC